MCIITKYNPNVCSVSKFMFANKCNNQVFFPDFHTVCHHLTLIMPCSKGLSIMAIQLSLSGCLDICTERENLRYARGVLFHAHGAV
jgi:hypothetical protein